MEHENFQGHVGHETNFRSIIGVWKNPQDIHKEIYIILSVTIKNNQESLMGCKN